MLDQIYEQYAEKDPIIAEILKEYIDYTKEQLLELDGIGISKGTRLLSCIELGKRVYLQKPIIYNHQWSRIP